MHVCDTSAINADREYHPIAGNTASERCPIESITRQNFTIRLTYGFAPLSPPVKL